MKYLSGIIEKSGYYVKIKNGQLFNLPVRGMCGKYPEVLIDATSVGGSSFFKRQCIKPYIGMKCVFVTNNNKYGYNFTLIK